MAEVQTPEGKETVAMAVVPAWAIELTQATKDGLRRIELQQNEQGEKLDLCIHGLGTVTTEVEKQGIELREFREWKGGVDERLKANSMRATQTSSVDLDHEAKIANVIVETQALKTAIHETRAIVDNAPTKEDLQKATDAQTTALLNRFDAVVKNPIVMKILYAVGGAIAAYLTAKGVK